MVVTEESTNSAKAKYQIVTPKKPEDLRVTTKQITSKTNKTVRDSQQFKSSVVSSNKYSQVSASSPERTGRFANMSDEEYAHYELERKATYYQKKVV